MFKKVFKVSFDRWYLAERAFGKLQRTENVEPYFPDGHTSKVFEVSILGAAAKNDMNWIVKNCQGRVELI